MKEAVLLMAKYNKFADEGLIEALKRAGVGKFSHNLGTYFGTIAATISHLVSGNVMFCDKYFKHYSHKEISCSDIVGFVDSEGLKHEILSDLDKLENCILRVDDKFIEIIENTHDFDCIGRIEFPGIVFEKPRHQLLLGVLNHATHHRGELSGMLDILGVENDFAGMFKM